AAKRGQAFVGASGGVAFGEHGADRLRVLEAELVPGERARSVLPATDNLRADVKRLLHRPPAPRRELGEVDGGRVALHRHRGLADEITDSIRLGQQGRRRHWSLASVRPFKAMATPCSPATCRAGAVICSPATTGSAGAPIISDHRPARRAARRTSSLSITAEISATRYRGALLSRSWPCSTRSARRIS